MKKNFLTAILAVAICSGIGYGLHANCNETSQKEFSALTLANVEALSYTEWGHDSGCNGPGSGCLLPESEWYHDLKGDYPD